MSEDVRDENWYDIIFFFRLVAVEGERTTLEQQLQNTIDDLTLELDDVKCKLETVTKERDEAIDKQREMEEHISKMGLVNKEAMDIVSNSIEWGKGNYTSFYFNHILRYIYN